MHQRRNAYDGELEYWVIIKETGKRTEESSYEEQRTKKQKAYMSIDIIQTYTNIKYEIYKI